jgi:TolB protein
MFFNNKHLRLITCAAGSIVLLAPLLACESTASLHAGFSFNDPAPGDETTQPTPGQPYTEAETAPGTSATNTPSPQRRHDNVFLFGDQPDQERVPFENRLITNLTRHTTTSDGLDFDPDIYLPEELLLFASTRHANRPDIFMKKIGGATLVQLTSDPADDIQPRISPDGQKVAFASNRTGNWDIWFINRDGTNLTQLTRDPSDEVAPCFSPDGTQVAYTLWGHRSRQWEIWTLSVAQPGVRRFLAYGMFPAWSPDGSKIAFQRARQRGSRLFSVWTLELVNGEARHPTEVAHVDSMACIAPRWSPDGSMLAYCTTAGDAAPSTASPGTPASADVWLVDADTGVRMKLTDSAAPAFNPVWADAGRVFFVSPRAGTENIWSITTSLGEYAVSNRSGPRVTRATGEESRPRSRN